MIVLGLAFITFIKSMRMRTIVVCLVRINFSKCIFFISIRLIRAFAERDLRGRHSAVPHNKAAIRTLKRELSFA